MQWKEDKSDTHNKIVKNFEPVLFRDSVIPSKDHTGIITNEKILSHDMDQEMHAKEVDRAYVCRTSSR
jgi:hypothetical protein